MSTSQQEHKQMKETERVVVSIPEQQHFDGAGDSVRLAIIYKAIRRIEQRVPPHIKRLYDHCCEMEEHVAKHTLEEFERCDICCENGEARKADIRYENAVIAWVNGLCRQSD